MTGMRESDDLPDLHGVFDEMVDAVVGHPHTMPEGPLRCVCVGLGVGGFESVARSLGLEVVYAGLPSDAGFWSPLEVAADIPDHELLIAGLPHMQGAPLEGVMRVVRVKRPHCVVLDAPSSYHCEMGKTVAELNRLGYKADRKSLPSDTFGAPEAGVRNVVVATRGAGFHWPFSGAPVAQEPDQAPGSMPVSMARALMFAAIDAMVREQAARNA